MPLSSFAEAYTLSGCTNPDHCGTFRRVAARCASGDYCPGGQYELSSTDPSLCGGAPVYQKGGADGPVLWRREYSAGRTAWLVGASSALETCYRYPGGAYLGSATKYQAGGPPTAPAYSTEVNQYGGTGWYDSDASPTCFSDCGVAVAAGGH